MLYLLQAWLSFHGLSVQGCVTGVTVLLCFLLIMKLISAVGYFKVPTLVEGNIKKATILYLQ